MKRYQDVSFATATIDEILKLAAEYKEKGYAFVQLCATTKEASCEILYTFQDPSYKSGGVEGFVVDVPDGSAVPSITAYFPAAFVFENEAHDLFGLNIEGISIDFEGNFYTVAVAYPMNPRAAVAQAEEGRKGEDDE